MADRREIAEVVRTLWKQGAKEEAREIFKIARGMNSESQELQMHFFEKALANTGVDFDSLSLDPMRRIMSFEVEGLNFMMVGQFIERFLRTINRVGNTTYKLEKIRRGDVTVIEIKIGR